MTPESDRDTRLPAVERLALSRQRLRESLQEASAPHGKDGEHHSVIMTALMAIPGARIVVDSVRSWWAQHPLHLATLVASNTARGVMQPMARRSPYRMLMAAAAVGGLLFLVKPWRGLLKPALLAGMLPHFVSRAAAHIPIESWVSALMTMASHRAGAHKAPAGAESDAPADKAGSTPNTKSAAAQPAPTAPRPATQAPAQPQPHAHASVDKSVLH